MEKKFDFKTIAIACLLFFGFVFLLFYKFSSADDSINHYKTASEIFSSQQDFDDFKSTLPQHILPEWYSDEESLVNLLDTIACFAMGDYLQVGSNVVQELSGQITGDPLFLQHFVFDYDSLSWVFDSDTDDFIKSKLDSHIYVSSGPVVGSWFETPFVGGEKQIGTYNFIHLEVDDSPGTQVYVTKVDDSIYVIAGFIPFSAPYRFRVRSSYTGNTETISSGIFTNIYTYQGSESLGFYTTYNDTSGNLPDNYTQYSSVDSALSVLFGWNGISSGGSLIPGVSIRNEDFNVKPLSYPASVMVDYPNEISYPDYDSDDTRLTFEYTYNMEVPFWLKNPTSEPISYELPTDYDFGSIDFEYDADPSYLAGAGIVQDVFEVLPASLQGLIALFGAGSLAFIFLRR